MSPHATNPHDLFRSRDMVPVSGGTLAVAHAGPAPDRAGAVVLAIHGITSNLMVWRSVARHIAEGARVSILAPDLRGRGESATLPGPYGIAAHVEDMLAVLDHFGVRRPVLAGHSMGAYVAARMAGEHPERTAGLVLVDGGPSVDAFTPEDAAVMRALMVGPAVARRAISYASPEAFLEFWQHHPAFVHAWNEDVEAYVLHDLAGDPGAMKYVINLNAVEADSDEMLSDPANRTSMDRVHVPVSLLRAPRGTLDDDNPLISRQLLEAFAAQHPAAHVDDVEGVNHYTVVLGDSPGPARVAAAIEAAAIAKGVRRPALLPRA
jgi:pimeloyl-ACP methyl ester carboxylesterase